MDTVALNALVPPCVVCASTSAVPRPVEAPFDRIIALVGPFFALAVLSLSVPSSATYHLIDLVEPGIWSGCFVSPERMVQ